jgi:hypothetical protein
MEKNYLNKINKTFFMATKRMTLKDLEVRLEEVRKEMSSIQEKLTHSKDLAKDQEVDSVKKQVDELNARLSKAEKNLDEIYNYMHNLYEYLKIN